PFASQSRSATRKTSPKTCENADNHAYLQSLTQLVLAGTSSHYGDAFPASNPEPRPASNKAFQFNRRKEGAGLGCYPIQVNFDILPFLIVERKEVRNIETHAANRVNPPISPFNKSSEKLWGRTLVHRIRNRRKLEGPFKEPEIRIRRPGPIWRVHYHSVVS